LTPKSIWMPFCVFLPNINFDKKITQFFKSCGGRFMIVI
jgi:hypothetical protein